MTLTELLALLATIGEMDDAALAQYEADLRAAVDEIAEDTTEDNIALLGEVADALDGIRAETTQRAEAEAERVAQRDAALARIRGEDGDGDEDEADADGGDDAEADDAEVVEPAEAEAEDGELVGAPAAAVEGGEAAADAGDAPEGGDAAPVAPAPARTPALAAMGARRPAAHAPRAARTAPRGPVIRVAGNVPMHSAGDEVTVSEAAFALSEKARLSAGMMGKFPVLSIERPIPPERDLSRLSSDAVFGAIEAVTSPKALQASGGVCAMLDPYYDLAVIAEADRAIPRALVPFRTTRGGLTFITPPQLSSILVNTAGQTNAGRAITIHTNADDIAARTKTRQRVSCGAQQSVTMRAIVDQLEFGNVASRTWPEGDDAFVALSLAQWARTADTALLQDIAAGSTVANTNQVFGATRDILAAMSRGYARYRRRHRITSPIVLRALLPDWVISLCQQDLTYAGLDGIDRDTTAEWFTARARARGFAVSFFYDGEDATQTMAQAQGIGGLMDFPNTMTWYFFHEGAWIYLDGGTLNLGVIRDATLVASNDFITFTESWEAVAMIGLESIKVTSQVCADGSAMGTFDPTDLGTLCDAASFGS